MSVKDITEEIKKIAAIEIEKIHSNANSEVKELENKYQKTIDEKKDVIKRKVTQKAHELKNGIITRKKLEMRSKVLEEKQKIVGKLFSMTKEKIQGLSKDDFLKFYTGILKTSDIPAEEYKLIRAQGDKIIDNDFVKRLSENTKVKMSLSEGDSFAASSGFLLKAEFVQLDFSLAAVLKNIRLEKESELVKILF